MKVLNLLTVHSLNRNEAMERMIFVKLGNDVSRLRKILSETIDDLDTTNDFRTLKLLIDTEIRLEAEEKNLIEQNSKCESLYRFLEKKFDEVNEKGFWEVEDSFQ